MNIEPTVLYKLVLVIGIMSAVIAAAISAIFQLINGWRERVAADKRHLRDLALKAATIQWEHKISETEKYNLKLPMGEDPIKLGEESFDMLFVRKLKLVNLFGKRNFSEADIRQGVAEMRSTAAAITKSFRTD
jgi:hypothetical protein